MMKFWKSLASLSLALFIATPVLLSGCGGGTNDEQGTEITVEEDTTLDPANDDTMSAETDEEVIVTE
jgi:hypothetical protein